MSKIVRDAMLRLPVRAISPPDLPDPEKDPAAATDFDSRPPAEELDGLLRQIAEKKEELDRIRQEASKLLATAQEEALRLMEEAGRASEEIRRKAGEEGFEAGRKSGFAEALQQERERLEQAAKILDAAEKERRTRIRSSEGALVSLAVAIAKRIVERELETDEEYAARVAEELLTQAERAYKVRLHVSPGNFAVALSERARFERLLPENSELTIVPDHGLTLGDAVLTSEFGTIDGRVATRFDQVRAALNRLAKEWEAHGDDAGTSLQV